VFSCSGAEAIRKRYGKELGELMSLSATACAPAVSAA
jgi:hypothetical protein